MKIALISSGSGARGGGEIYLDVLAQGLAELGLEPLLLIPDTPAMDDLARRAAGNGTRIMRFAFSPTYTRRLRNLGAWADRKQQRRLARLFAGLGVDLLHVNQQVAEDGLDLVQAARLSGIPWISTVHIGHSARDLNARAAWGRDRITTRVLARRDSHYIGVSTVSARQLEARFGAGGATIHTALNGVPVPDPQALATARRRARSDWGAAEDDVVIGAVGRIEAQKAPLDLLAHLAPIAANRPEARIRMVWIGDGSLRGALETRARTHAPDLPLHVDGWREDAALRMAGLDVLAMPSVFEGLPLALLEAMHVGLPIIANHADGIAEAVTHSQTGLLCHVNAAWQPNLQALLGDPALRQMLGEAARDTARARFSTRAMAEATAELYRAMLPAGWSR